MPLAIFDLDNTLVDRDAAFARWAQAFCRTRAKDTAHVRWMIDVNQRMLQPSRRVDYVAYFDEVCRKLELDEGPAALAASFYDEYLEHYRAGDDTLRAITRLRDEGWKTGIATNGPPTQEDKIQAAGLGPLVDAFAVSDVEGFDKPDVRLFELVAQRCGHELDANDWVIGDDPAADIGGAHDLGLHSVWVTRGEPWPDDLAFKATLEADSVANAVDAILDRNSSEDI